MPGKRSYDRLIDIPPDIPGGEWQGELTLSASADLNAARSARGPEHLHDAMDTSVWDTRCYTPELEGQAKFSFTLESPAGLVTPSSAVVTVNPSQVQLLLGEADGLKAKAQQIKEQLSSEDPAANQVLLQNSLKDAVDDLDKTEKTYQKLELEPSSSRAINIFFDDIRFGYGEARKALTNQSAQGSQSGPRLERVSAALGGPSPRLNEASEKSSRASCRMPGPTMSSRLQSR